MNSSSLNLLEIFYINTNACKQRQIQDRCYASSWYTHNIRIHFDTAHISEDKYFEVHLFNFFPTQHQVFQNIKNLLPRRGAHVYIRISIMISFDDFILLKNPVLTIPVKYKCHYSALCSQDSCHTYIRTYWKCGIITFSLVFANLKMDD